jgi:S-adenosylmethionine decarboxylase
MAVIDLAPNILRQRLLLEGFYSGEISADRCHHFLLGLAGRLALRTYADPIVYARAAGDGQEDNQGFDACSPLIDSGIAAYFWTGR